jgi:hypothetical protein
MDNPEKLATWGTQDKKNNTVCVGHHDTSTNNMVCFPDHTGWLLRKIHFNSRPYNTIRSLYFYVCTCANVLTMSTDNDIIYPPDSAMLIDL